MEPHESLPNPHPPDHQTQQQGHHWQPPQAFYPQQNHHHQPAPTAQPPMNGHYHPHQHHTTYKSGPIPSLPTTPYSQPSHHPPYPIQTQHVYHPVVPPPHMYQHPPPPIPTIEAVPQPTPRVAYEAPVFQTFQERRRAKEMALRQVAGTSSPSSPITPIHNSPSAPRLPTVPSQPVPSPLSQPSPATVAMMGRPSVMAGPPPAPPARSRSRSPGLPPSTDSPLSRTPISPLPGSQPRPLPAPRVPHSASFGTPSAITQLSSGPSSPFTPTRGGVPPVIAHSPIEANLERSDTISSVKSLDRMGFSSSPAKRALPKPPVGVNSSRSLDRGIPTGVGASPVEGYRKGATRKQPSTVSEEPNEEGLIQGMAATRIDDKAPVAPTVPTIRTPSPSSNSRPPSIVLPGEAAQPPVDPRAPARFAPLPAINVPESDTSSAVSTDDEKDASQNDTTPRKKRLSGPSSPGIQFSGLPTISVSTSDSADEPPQGGEISFSVPSIHVASPSAPSINVPSVKVPSTPSGSSNPVRSRVHNDGAAILCTGCGNPIIGRIVNAMNQRWHPQCFMCAECGELLEHKFAHRCHHCQTPIVDSRFVTLNDPVLGQRYYHELHFFCSECGDPFLDPSKSSAPGTEKLRGANDDEEEEEDGETNAFVIHRGHPYCERCHLRLHKPKCKACTKPIPDIAINAMGAKWHKECFVCSRCHQEFANNLFFPKGGNAFCTSCYEDTIASEP